jgi:hypothetical protein
MLFLFIRATVWLEDLRIVELAAGQQHAQERQVVATGRVEAAAAHEEFGRLRHREFDRGELAVGAAGMDARHARVLIGLQDEDSVLHAERGEDALPHIAIQRQAAHPLDRLAGPVDVDAVIPLVAGVGDQSRLRGLELAGADAGNVGDLHVALDILVPQVVAAPSARRPSPG